MPSDTVGYYKESSFRQKLMSKLFPHKHVEAVFPDWAGKGDVIHNIIRTRFSFIDRLRILVTGYTETKILITCENLVGKTSGISVSYPTTKEVM